MLSMNVNRLLVTLALCLPDLAVTMSKFNVLHWRECTILPALLHRDLR